MSNGQGMSLSFTRSSLKTAISVKFIPLFFFNVKHCHILISCRRSLIADQIVHVVSSFGTFLSVGSLTCSSVTTCPPGLSILFFYTVCYLLFALYAVHDLLVLLSVLVNLSFVVGCKILLTLPTYSYFPSLKLVV